MTQPPYPTSHTSPSTEWSQDDVWAKEAAADRARLNGDSPRDTDQQIGPGRPALSDLLGRLTRRRALILGVAVLVVVGALIAGLAVALFRTPAAPPPATASLSRPAPAGWQPEFHWVADGDTGVSDVVASGNYTAYRADNRVVVRNADTGAEQWAAPLDASDTATLALVEVFGRATVVLSDNGQLKLWPAETGQNPATLALPPDAHLATNGGGLMVFKPGEQSWRITGDYAMEPVTIPDGHVPYGVEPDGTAVTAPETGQWALTGPDGATTTVRPGETPQDATGPMQLAWHANGYMVAWAPTGDDTNHVVAVYEVATGKMIAAQLVNVADVEAGLAFAVDPDRKYASAGPMLVDLANETSTAVPYWETLTVTNRAVYGTVNGKKMQWSAAAGEPVEIDPAAALPWGVTEAGTAVVTDRTSEGHIAVGGLPLSE